MSPTHVMSCLGIDKSFAQASFPPESETQPNTLPYHKDTVQEVAHSHATDNLTAATWRDQLEAEVLRVKREHPSFGRTRIRRAIDSSIRGSESTISRILRKYTLQNEPKRPVKRVELSLETTLEDTEGDLTQRGVGKLLLHDLYRTSLGDRLATTLSEEVAKAIQVYACGLIDGKALYQALDVQCTHYLEATHTTAVTPSKIRAALEEIGTRETELRVLFSPRPDDIPKAVAIDEKVDEKWTSKVDSHYVSRRGKGMPSTSIEVVADIDERGMARPLLSYLPSFASEAKDESESVSKVSGNEQQGNRREGTETGVHEKENKKGTRRPVKDKQGEQLGGKERRGKRRRGEESRKLSGERNGRSQCTAKGGGKNKGTGKRTSKREEVIFQVLGLVAAALGMVALRMDNRYGTKRVIRYLNKKRWRFIVHGRSNLKVAGRLKREMKERGLTYHVVEEEAAAYGGRIRVVGYRKGDRTYVYLTNELGTAREIMERYRPRWRIETLFRYCSAFEGVKGLNLAIHRGHSLVVMYYLSEVARGFRSALETVGVIVNKECTVRVKGGELRITYRKLARRYVRKLEHFVTYMVWVYGARMSIITYS